MLPGADAPNPAEDSNDREEMVGSVHADWRGSTIHDATFAALKQLGADDVRYAASHPYPRGRRAAHERLAGQHPHAASVRGGSLDGNISARGDSLTRSRIG